MNATSKVDSPAGYYGRQLEAMAGECSTAKLASIYSCRYNHDEHKNRKVFPYETTHLQV